MPHRPRANNARRRRPMKILAIDTSGGACSVGMWRDGTMLADDSRVMAQGHAEALMPMIERVMADAGVAYAALDRIAVTVGPGSFTGVRVGIATARGLALATDAPVIGLTVTETLAAMAAERQADTTVALPILAVVDSKRGDVFAQAFAPDLRARGEIEVVAVDRLPTWIGPGMVIVVGDGTDAALAALGPRAARSPAAPICAPATLARLAAERTPDPRGALPIYGRAPDVTLRADGGVLRP
jgi:tRNA threonylcarbamoyladenosine biosynthesis protein TsaB